MYWSQVIRPGDHIAAGIDSRQVPATLGFAPATATLGPSFPSFDTHSFVANGFNVGVEFGF